MNCCVCCNPILKTNSVLFLRLSMLVTVGIQGLKQTLQNEFTTDNPDKGMQLRDCVLFACKLLPMPNEHFKNHSN